MFCTRVAWTCLVCLLLCKELLKNELQNTNIYEKMNHDIYANPNMNYQILINALSKAKLTQLCPKLQDDTTNVRTRKKSG